MMMVSHRFLRCICETYLSQKGQACEEKTQACEAAHMLGGRIVVDDLKNDGLCAFNFRPKKFSLKMLTPRSQTHEHKHGQDAPYHFIGLYQVVDECVCEGRKQKNVGKCTIWHFSKPFRIRQQIADQFLHNVFSLKLFKTLWGRTVGGWGTAYRILNNIAPPFSCQPNDIKRFFNYFWLHSGVKISPQTAHNWIKGNTNCPLAGKLYAKCRARFSDELEMARAFGEFINRDLIAEVAR